MIQGTARVHSEPSRAQQLAREAAKLRVAGVPEQELPTEPRWDSVYIKVTPLRIRLWDSY